jgi:hypothetical protein
VNSAPAHGDPSAERRARIGLALILLGIAGILWGVFHVLGAQPRPAQLDFAHRVTDHQARSAVHESFLGGLVRALAGLGVAMLGGRMRSKALKQLGRAQD